MPQENGHETAYGEMEDTVESAEDGNPNSDENDDHGNCIMDLDEAFGDDDPCATQEIELGDAPKSELLSTNDSGISLEEGTAEAADDEPSERRPITDEA